MGYAILRATKIKHVSKLRRSLMHAYREQETPNADPDRLRENTHVGADSSREALDRFKARLDTQEKVRKNAVLAVEYLVTGSPEDLHEKTREEQDAYFRDALKWLEAKHGKENVIYAGVHRDEKSPHMYAYVVPIDERGKLNCRRFLGGYKALSEMQTDFAKNVGAKYGLLRGIEGSRAKHQRVKEFYGAIVRKSDYPKEISADEVKPRVTRKGLIADDYEKPADIAARLNAKVRQSVAPAVEKGKLAELQARRAAEERATAKAKDNEAFFAKLKAQELEETFAVFSKLAHASPQHFRAFERAVEAQLIQLEAQKRAQERAQEAKRTRTPPEPEKRPKGPEKALGEDRDKGPDLSL